MRISDWSSDVCSSDLPACAIIKHANPCGVAVADDLATAYARALACDPVSAFGGIIALNRPLDGATAAAIAGIFSEVVIAPDADGAARAARSEEHTSELQSLMRTSYAVF